MHRLLAVYAGVGRCKLTILVQHTTAARVAVPRRRCLRAAMPGAGGRRGGEVQRAAAAVLAGACSVEV